MQFLGNIPARSDQKGRFFLPSAMRKVLQAENVESLVLRKDFFQDCLVLFPLEVWNAKLEMLRSRLNYFDRRHQLIMRQYVADAEAVTLDASGRLLIPRRCMEKAGIISEVSFIGVNDTIEIWAKEKLDRPFMDSEEFADSLEEVMSGIMTE